MPVLCYGSAVGVPPNVAGGTIAVQTIDYAGKWLKVTLRASNYPTPGTYMLFDYANEVNGSYTTRLNVDPGDTGLTVLQVVGVNNVPGTLNGNAIYVSLV